MMDDEAIGDSRANAIYATLRQFLAGNWMVTIPVGEPTDVLNATIACLHQLAQRISSMQKQHEQQQQQLQALIDMTTSMAALDFSERAPVNNSGSLVDSLAVHMNMLGDVLNTTIVSRTYVDTMIEALLDTLIIVEHHGTIQVANRAAISCFGYPLDQLLGQPITRLVDDADRVYRMLETVVHTNTSVSEEILCRTQHGRSFPALFSASAMDSDNGGLLGIVCVIRDLSERKDAEQALRQSIAQEETIRAQAQVLAALSTPLIPLSDSVVVMPLIGALDVQRTQLILETLLQGIAASTTEVAIIDITGVPVVDTHVAQALVHAAQAVTLLGAEVVLTGIRPEVAQTLVGLGVNLRGITTHGTLQSGVAAILRKQGAN